jgi:hypothetical protein
MPEILGDPAATLKHLARDSQEKGANVQIAQGYEKCFRLDPVGSGAIAAMARFAKGVLTLEIGKAAAPPAKVKQVDVKPA